MNVQAIEDFGREWLRSWERRDLDNILEHHADDVEVQSPLVVHFLGDSSGRVTGKEKLREYFGGKVRHAIAHHRPAERRS